MPRACPVEIHVCSYTEFKRKGFPMPRACPVEIHVCSYTEFKTKFPDATGLPRGDSRSLLFS